MPLSKECRRSTFVQAGSGYHPRRQRSRAHGQSPSVRSPPGRGLEEAIRRVHAMAPEVGGVPFVRTPAESTFGGTNEEVRHGRANAGGGTQGDVGAVEEAARRDPQRAEGQIHQSPSRDRKRTRLNSSH